MDRSYTDVHAMCRMLVPLKNRNHVRVAFPKCPSISNLFIHIPYFPMLSYLISVVVVVVVLVVDYVIAVDSVVFVLGVVGKADDRNRCP